MTIDKSSLNGKFSAKQLGRVLPDEFYSSFISDAAKARKPAPIRSLVPLESKPDMISMLAGKPNPDTYPFANITMSIKSPNPADSSLTNVEIAGQDLTDALQYGSTAGVPALVDWLTNMAQKIHGLEPGDGARVSVGAGSQDLLYKAFTALISRGDAIFVEAPTYPGIIPILDSLGCEAIEVVSDAHGIDPASITQIVGSWPSEKPLPKLLYTIPFGANPSGVTTSLPRRIEVLRLARKYNFLIFEDDPYYHIYYGSGPRPDSYLSLERRIPGNIGGVLRFDSLSKIIAAGIRVGWATGPAFLLTQMERHTAASNLQPSSFSQVVILKVLQSWGYEGFLVHVDGVAEFYRQKRDVFETYVQKHLGGLAEWYTPDAAMFYWIKLRLPRSGAVELRNVKGEEGDSKIFVEHKAVKKGVLMLPGESGYLDGRKSCYVRLSFSLLSEQEVDEGLRRLAAALRDDCDVYNAC